MQHNPDLIDLSGVCAYFNLSESSIRRKVRDSRNGIGNFPIPLFRSRCRVLWRKSEIEAWQGEDGETVMFTPSQIPPNHRAIQIPSSAQVRKGLEAFGISLPHQSGKGGQEP